MRKLMRRFSVLLVLAVAVSLFGSVRTLADEEEATFYGLINEESGYEYFVDDANYMFSYDEILALLDVLSSASEYGNVGVITIGECDYSSTAVFATDYIDSCFGNGSNSAVFVIDMDNRWLDITSEGALRGNLTPSKSNVITDNVYKYAADGDYYICAHEAVEQMCSVLEGARIAQPMKYLSNGCLAILFALIINYFFARIVSTTFKASDREMIGSAFNNFILDNPNAQYTHTTKEYSPRSSSSSGSSSGGGGGGGGGSSSGGHGF